MEHLDLQLAALANPTRRRILEHLARGTATVNELARGCGRTQPTLSSHLDVLERAGLVTRGRVAQTRPCRLVPAALREVASWLGRLEGTPRDAGSGSDVRLT